MAHGRKGNNYSRVSSGLLSFHHFAGMSKSILRQEEREKIQKIGKMLGKVWGKIGSIGIY